MLWRYYSGMRKQLLTNLRKGEWIYIYMQFINRYKYKSVLHNKSRAAAVQMKKGGSRSDTTAGLLFIIFSRMVIITFAMQLVFTYRLYYICQWILIIWLRILTLNQLKKLAFNRERFRIRIEQAQTGTFVKSPFLMIHIVP